VVQDRWLDCTSAFEPAAMCMQVITAVNFKEAMCGEQGGVAWAKEGS